MERAGIRTCGRGAERKAHLQACKTWSVLLARVCACACKTRACRRRVVEHDASRAGAYIVHRYVRAPDSRLGAQDILSFGRPVDLADCCCVWFRQVRRGGLRPAPQNLPMSFNPSTRQSSPSPNAGCQLPLRLRHSARGDVNQLSAPGCAIGIRAAPNPSSTTAVGVHPLITVQAPPRTTTASNSDGAVRAFKPAPCQAACKRLLAQK